MKLYHGTSADVARRAPSEGLAPRAVTRRKSNWRIGSTDQLVYLTSTYALHFAFNATSEGERWGVVEVDTDRLDQSLMYPDEDFLEQISRGVHTRHTAPPTKVDIQERTLWYRERLLEYQPLWQDSLDNLGCIGYRGKMPGSAVTRVSLYDPESNPTVTGMAIDGMVLVANYRVCGDMHRALTEWVMGDAVAPQRLCIGWELLPEQHQERFASALNDTSGIEIVYDRSGDHL